MIDNDKTIEEIKNITIFFIIGRPRSGTTLLQSIFDSHPNVMIPAESQVIVRLYNKFNKVKEWDQTNIKKLISILKSIRLIKLWRINYEKLETELIQFLPELDFTSIIKIIYLNFSTAYNKQKILIIGDKNPPYSKFPKLILKIFPEAKYIIIHRDYRDHFLSMKKTGLMSKAEIAIIYTWKRYIYQWKKMQIKFPNQAISFRYEDFIQEPEKYLIRFCSFINIPFSTNLLYFYKNKDEALNQYKEKRHSVFHKNIYNPIIATNYEKWKQELSTKEIMIADYIIKDSAKELGYEPKFKSFPFKFHLYMLHRLFIMNMFNFMRILVLIIPYSLRVKFKGVRIFSSSHKFYLLFFKN